MKTKVTVDWKAVVKCPVCESTERHWYWQTFWGELTISFWICECGLVYSDRVPKNEKEAEIYYSEYYSPMVEAHHAVGGLRANELVRARRVLDNAIVYPEIKRHLDIGCGHGILMQEMKKKYGCISEGCDIRSFAEEDGYKVYKNFSEITEPYDLVTCIHALEHVVDPLQFLKDMTKVCSRFLFIEVPSFRPSVGLLSSHHLFGFTIHSLADIVARAGFVVKEVRQVIHSTEIGDDGRTRGKIELELWAEVEDE